MITCHFGLILREIIFHELFSEGIYSVLSDTCNNIWNVAARKVIYFYVLTRSAPLDSLRLYSLELNGPSKGTPFLDNSQNNNMYFVKFLTVKAGNWPYVEKYQNSLKNLITPFKKCRHLALKWIKNRAGSHGTATLQAVDDLLEHYSQWAWR